MPWMPGQGDAESVTETGARKSEEMPEDNPNKITDIECACGCTTLLPRRLVDAGWKYIRGHKPAGAQKAAKNPKGLKTHTGPEQIEAYFEAQVEQLRKTSHHLKAEAQELLATARHKMAMAKEIDEQIAQLNTVKAQTSEALSRVLKSGRQ
jgi:hypothetical protein